MTKIEIIKSLYEELNDEEKTSILNMLHPCEHKKEIDFYSDDFIDFITRSNFFRKQLYLLDCGEINTIVYFDTNLVKHSFDHYDDADKYWEENFDKVMKVRYADGSDEYKCFNILTTFDFEDVEKKSKKLEYTYGLENKSITKERLINDSVEMLRNLCSDENINITQRGRLHAVKISYDKEEGGNYFLLMFGIEYSDSYM